MDCCICAPLPLLLRTTRNIICPTCHEGAKGLNDFLFSNLKSGQTDLPKGLANALKLMEEMKEREEVLNEKLSFLEEFSVAFRDGFHTDIHLKPSNGPCIPAHRALLAARSEIFKNMLDSDGCKAPPNDTISIPELKHDELQTLLEFLYNGSLPTKKVENHLYSLYAAADKYEIHFLQKFCERRILESLNSSNALDVLEISDVHSNITLSESAINFIVQHMEDIVFSNRYDEFGFNNPHLNVEIMRRYLMATKV